MRSVISQFVIISNTSGSYRVTDVIACVRFCEFRDVTARFADCEGRTRTVGLLLEHVNARVTDDCNEDDERNEMKILEVRRSKLSCDDVTHRQD